MQILFIFQLRDDFDKTAGAVPAHPAAEDAPPARGLLVVTIDTLRARHPAGGAGDSAPAPVSIGQVDVGAPAVGAGVQNHSAY